MQPADRPRGEETHYPLDLMYCDDCTLAQLSVAVDPEVVFPVDYPYSSGNSQGATRELRGSRPAGEPVLRAEVDLVVDIGANDGTLLGKFGDCRTVGVEPTDQATRIDGPALSGFLHREGWRGRSVEEHGQAKVITACNVLAHVEDIDDVMRGIRLLLAPDGVLIAENHDLASVVDGQWDTIYHEHLRFFSPYSFDWLLRKHGLASRSGRHPDAWRFVPDGGAAGL